MLENSYKIYFSSENRKLLSYFFKNHALPFFSTLELFRLIWSQKVESEPSMK